MNEQYLDVNNLSGEVYERLCAQYLAQHGFRDIEFTNITDDYGADIVAKDSSGNKWVFQCKRYSESVGKSAVQEVVAAKAHYRASYAGVITNSYLTKGAKYLATENNVTVYENIMPGAINSKRIPQRAYKLTDEPSGALGSWALFFSIIMITAPIGLLMAIFYLYRGGKARQGRAVAAIVLSSLFLALFFAGAISNLSSCQSSDQRTAPSQEARNDTSMESERATSRGTSNKSDVESLARQVQYKVIVNAGRIRTGPGTDTDTICLVYLDDEIEGTGKSKMINNTTWYEVYYNDSGDTGWASEIVISPIESGS